jgi:hypothetical protein
MLQYSPEAMIMRLRHGFLNAYQLKLLMAALMLLDHIYYFLRVDALTWGHYLARLVIPVFAYLMTEGMIYTKSRGRYIARMLGFGFAMLAGTICLRLALGMIRLTGTPDEAAAVLLAEMSRSTILIALGLSAALIAAIDKLRERESVLVWIAVIFGLIMASFLFESGPLLPLIAVTFYYCRKKPGGMSFLYAIECFFLYGKPFFTTGPMPVQFYMIFGLIPIFCYNGQRGSSSKFAKYFFYVFYPLHIWALIVIGWMVS